MYQNELQQFANKDKLYIAGKIVDVTEYLKTLSYRYQTVREYLDDLTREL